MDETFKELTSVLKERLRATFFVVFIVVWVIHYWPLWLGVFTFDDEMKQIDKLNFVRSFFDGRFFYGDILWLVFLTLLSIIFSYLVLAIVRSIESAYRIIVVPLIDKELLRGVKYVTAEEYVKKEEEVRRLTIQNYELSEKLKTYISAEERENLESEDDQIIKMLSRTSEEREKYIEVLERASRGHIGSNDASAKLLSLNLLKSLSSDGRSFGISDDGRRILKKLTVNMSN